jgi:hypothetical protein
MTAAYAVSGPTRGGFLMLLACSMVFGAFTPKRTHTRNACALTLALLAAVMFFKSRINALCYPARIEAIHFLLFTVTLTTIAAVAGQLRFADTADGVQRRTGRCAETHPCAGHLR